MRPEQPTVRRPRVPVPVDHSLRGLGALLDADRVGAAAAGGLLAPGSRVRECRPVYVRYKPDTNCIAAFELRYDDAAGEARVLRLHGKCVTAADHVAYLEKLATKRWVEPEGGRPWVSLDAEHTVLFAFPNDPGLDGLRLLSHPKKIQRALYDHAALAPSEDWRISDRRLSLTTVRHKPEKRAVTRVDTRAVHRGDGEKRPLRVYLRTYQDDRGAAMHGLMRHLETALADARGVAVPRSIGYLEDRQTLMVADAPGRPLSLALGEADVVTAVTCAAAALARLHVCPPAVATPRSIADLVSDARDTGRTVARLLPELATEVEALLGELEARARELRPAAPRLVHGDFHPDQVLVQDGRATLLDFDRTHVGDPAADVGNFRANLVRLELQGAIEGAEALADCFENAHVEATGTRVQATRQRFWNAYGLFQLSANPFRSLSANWPAEVAHLVTACWGVLS